MKNVVLERHIVDKPSITEDLSYKQQKYLTEIQPHKEHLTSVRAWDLYAKEHGLVSSRALIYHFKSFNYLKELLGLTIQESQYDKEHLLALVREHKDALTTISMWDAYAKDNALPSASTLISRFENWNTLKTLVNVPPSKSVANTLYSKESVTHLLNEHGKHYQNQVQWDKYASENGLPSYRTIRTLFSWDEFKKVAKFKTRYDYTQEELLHIAQKHGNHFTSAKNWNEYAKKHRLPSASTYARKIGFANTKALVKASSNN
ncbi:hypothetical protein ACFSCX_06875 [Bacillus salitolerans]|uniref:Uncharacterized protein n=1 Tax=Bacillus salitolerans TaxID=1437434 RepID=A0ABW4LQG0_9BACI